MRHVLLFAALLMLLQRRYLLMILPAVAMTFTRPGGLAFALLLLGHLVHRVLTRRRDPLSFRQAGAIIVAGLTVALAGVLWPVIAALVTGVPDAYTATELSWRSDYIGPSHLVPFAPWFQAVAWWFSVWLRLSPWLGYLTLVLILALFAIWMFTPSVRKLGVDLRFWFIAYALYLLAVFFPQSSTFRLLAPMAPLAGALAQPTSRVYRVAAVIACLVLQWGWLLLCWGVDGADWSPP